jgi:hypothetical protein
VNTDTLFPPAVKSDAVISACGVYRYSLTRTWDEALPVLAIIGLNPSTADAKINDPTIRREMDFARRWGFGGIAKGNLFAYRATNPKVMLAAAEPIGRENDATLLGMTEGRRVLCAWGTDGPHRGRDRQVIKLLAGRELVCLGLTKDGHPRHPLYLRADVAVVPFVNKHPDLGARLDGKTGDVEESQG